MGGRLNKSYYKIKKTGETVNTYGSLVDARRRQLGKADPLEHFICAIVAELDKEELSAKTSQQHLELKLKGQLETKRKEEKTLQKKKENWLQAIESADGGISELVKRMEQTQYDIDQVKAGIFDLERQLSDLITSSGVHNRKEVALLRDNALEKKDLQSRQDMRVVLGDLIERLDLGLHPDDLPNCSNDFVMHALTLHATTPIKFWARIKLFNDAIILGAMTADGQIARIRWEEE